MITGKLKLFAYPLLLFMAALSAGRLYFFIKYYDLYTGSDALSIAGAFIRGLRFDLSTASSVSAPFMIILFLPHMSRIGLYLKLLLYSLLAWFSVLTVFNCIDIQYYAFTERHITYELANTWRDTPVIFKIGFKRYLPDMAGLSVFLIIFSIAYVKLMRGVIKENRNLEVEKGRILLKGIMKDSLVLLVVVVLSVLFIRGGIQRKSLSAINAFADEKVELGNLSLNGVFTALNTVYRMGLYKQADGVLLPSLTEADRSEVIGFILSDNERSERDYPLYRRLQYQSSDRRQLNVVLIIMESWSSKYMASLGGAPAATPYFDKLSEEGLLVKCLANAQRSFRGLTAILGSVPVYEGTALGHETLLYQTKMEPLGKILKDYGYETLFIHGAPPTSMRLDSLVKRLGIERHISREDFAVGKETDDGVWGIYDEYVFMRADEEFRKIDRPFFAVVFSLSSHSPYKVPSPDFEYYDSSVEHRDFLNTVRYADYALGRFFEEARKSAYFDNTLFVVTSDHTEGSNTRDNIYNAYGIPCLFLKPGLISPGTYDEAASQVDIAPSLMDALRINAPYTGWGKSVFRGGPRRALLGWGGDMFVWVDRPYMLLSDLNSVKGFYDYTARPIKDASKEPGADAVSGRLHGELLRYIGFSNEIISGNRLKPPR